MNSFRAVYRALEYEAVRQGRWPTKEAKLHQETRGWLDEKGITVIPAQQGICPRLPLLPGARPAAPGADRGPGQEIKASLPELAEARRERFVSQYGLPAYDAGLLTNSKPVADYFEACVAMAQGAAQQKKAKSISNWILGEFARWLNSAGIEVHQSKVTPALLVELIGMADEGTVTGPAAKEGVRGDVPDRPTPQRDRCPARPHSDRRCLSHRSSR